MVRSVRILLCIALIIISVNYSCNKKNYNFSANLNNANHNKSYIYSSYENDSLIIRDRKVFFYYGIKKALVDSLENSPIVDSFLATKLIVTDSLLLITKDTSNVGKYFGLGNIFYSEVINGTTILEFDKPISAFWFNPKYKNFIQRLYGLHGFFISRELDKKLKDKY